VHLSFLVQHETLFVPLAAVFQNTVDMLGTELKTRSNVVWWWNLTEVGGRGIEGRPGGIASRMTWKVLTCLKRMHITRTNGERKWRGGGLATEIWLTRTIAIITIVIIHHWKRRPSRHNFTDVMQGTHWASCAHYQCWRVTIRCIYFRLNLASTIMWPFYYQIMSILCARD